jgi:hypothetical protein
LEGQIRDAATILGWAYFHPWLAIHSPAGWPDIALCRPPRLILAELKSDAGKTTAAQTHWLDLLAQCPGVETYLWRPRDWDEIMATLR